MSENKMSWLINQHLNGNVDYEIQNTNRNHGAISKPTGSGKSSLFINDIIWRINHKDPSKKLMINISTPIIKLCEMQGNDIMTTLEGVAGYYNIDLKRIGYFINNSGNIDAYKNTKTSLQAFSLIWDNFINHPNKDIAIIISCHPSLSERLIPFLKKNYLNGVDIVTYIDEAHTISYKITSDEDKDDTQIDLKTLCEKSSTYLISATNKKELVEIVNSYDNVYNDSYIIMETPADAISANKICAPKVHIKQTTDGEINFDICDEFMKQISSDGNIHKVLITCKDTKHLKSLKNELKENGYIVFSTCSADGMNWMDNTEFENSNHSFNDVVSFINAIDECSSNCFILHIRQMISGIDVGSISDCIIQKNNTSDFNSYSTTIQTIGRSLRLGKEREKNIEDRKKKYANVLFVSDENNETLYNDIEYFLINYYGLGHYEFHVSNSGIKFSPNDMDDINIWESMFNTTPSNTVNYWENVKTNIRKYILDKVKPIVDQCKEFGIPYNTLIEDEINNIEKKYHENLNSVYIFKYIYNKDLRNEVTNLMNELIIKITSK